MMTHCTQAARQMERRWLAPLVGSLVLATVSLETLQPGGLASAADCLANQGIVAVPDTPSWGVLSSPIPVPSALVTENGVCEQTPYVTCSRFVLGKADNPWITTLTAGLSPNTRKTTLFDQATLGSTCKLNSRIQALRTSTPPYSSTWRVIKIRKNLSELKRSVTYKSVAAFIGPAQEFQDSPLADGRSVPQTIPSTPSMDKPSALFGDHPWGPLSQFQDGQRLRMANLIV